MKWARVMLPLTTFGVSACGVLLGIETDLSAPPDDAGADIVEASVEVEEASTDSAVDVDAGNPARRPPPGTYVYQVATGSGDFLGGAIPPGQNTSYPPTTTIDVAYEDAACFTMKLTLRAGYTETFRFCVDADTFVLDTVVHDQAFSGASTKTKYACDARAIFFMTSTPPDTRKYGCAGNQNEPSPDPKNAFLVNGTYTFDGGGTQAVQNEIVAIDRFYDSQSVTNASNNQPYGGSQTHWHFATETGVLVHFERTTDTTYMYAPTVHYKEHVILDLFSRPEISDAGADADADSD